MSGLTDDEIQARRVAIGEAQEARINREGTIYFWEMTPAEIRELSELNVRTMVNSCLAYGSAQTSFYTGKYLIGYGTHYRRPLECDRCSKEQNEAYAVPDSRVIELYKEQAERFAKAKVIPGVFTDSEGCSYNSVLWDGEEK